MPPTASQKAELKELAGHCSKFVQELSALERTVRLYAWSIEQERQDLALLDSKIAMLEIASLTKDTEESVEPALAVV